MAAALPTASRWANLRDTCGSTVAQQTDRIYVSFDDHLMATALLTSGALAKPASVEGNIRDIVQHPAGIHHAPEAPPEGEPTRSRRSSTSCPNRPERGSLRRWGDGRRETVSVCMAR